MDVSASNRPPRSSASAPRLGPLDVLVLAALCGLAGGELEVAARVANRALGSTHRLYMMTRHFVWLVPLIDLAMLLGIGAPLAWAVWRWPRRAGWWGPRLLIALAVVPALALAGRAIYVEAWALVALGIAARAAPVLERHPAGARRWLARTAPAMLGLVLLQAAWVVGAEPLRRWRERGRPMPPAGSPDVLLIVLDTVRADHLSLYGYRRTTTPVLERMAARGVRFDEARAPSPWTLPSHASFFTGRWPHELGVQWRAPARLESTTLAEYLGDHGYATAGFVANTGYCSYETGLDRGFAHYEDYVLEFPGSLRTSRLFDDTVKTFLEWTGPLDYGWIHRLRVAMGGWFFADDRKTAESINRDVLDWLARRDEPDRPAFVFLNYLDAHVPYLLPPGVPHRFGADPRTRALSRELLMDWSLLDKQKFSGFWTEAADAYDSCLAYLDEQIGALFDELRRRGVLDRMLVIITSDHGEGLGEHSLFLHGESLYRTEVRVPLLILPPSGGPAGAVVRQPVSLRDLPATVVDLIGLGDRSPFPGRSLARLWADRPTAAPPAETEAVLSELAAPNPSKPNQGRSPAHRGPLISLAEGDYVYIRNEGDGGEELFNNRDDPYELTNLARVEAMRPVLRRFRDLARRAKAPDPSAGEASAAARVVAVPDAP